MINYILRKTHSSLVMNRRITSLSNHISELLIESEASNILDVGCGSGEIAKTLTEKIPSISIEGVDVFVRPVTSIHVTKFDGVYLPFSDNSFDAVILVDVIHHANDQKSLLQECYRVSKKFVLIKDHICNSTLDQYILSAMDWVGNKPHGVVLPYNYLSNSEWQNLYSNCHLSCMMNKTQLELYPKPFTYLFDSSLHFIDLLQKNSLDII